MSTIPDETLAKAKASITQEPDCNSFRGYKIAQGRRGDTLVLCRGCPRFAVVETIRQPGPAPVREPMPEPVVPPSSQYACRTHQRVVDWRGNGCPDCDAEHLEHEDMKRAKHARKMQSEATREWNRSRKKQS